jgi:hypothetical protein
MSSWRAPVFRNVPPSAPREARASGTDIQLPVAEAVVAEPLVLLINFGTKHIAIEGIQAFPIGYGDHAVVDDDVRQHATDAARQRGSTPAGDGPVQESRMRRCSGMSPEADHCLRARSCRFFSAASGAFQ